MQDEVKTESGLVEVKWLPDRLDVHDLKPLQTGVLCPEGGEPEIPDFLTLAKQAIQFETVTTAVVCTQLGKKSFFG